ncbi:MAG: CbiX/SirB N-terminal domain-containing protein [Coriobacteriia bacterium]
MPYGIWTAVLITALGCGAAFVGLLVSRRGMEAPLALLTLAFIAGNTLAILQVVKFYDLPVIALAAGAVSFAAAMGGWGLVSALMPLALESREAPPKLSDVPQANDVGPVVLLLACLEPETYSPRRVADELAALSNAGLREVGLIITPFLYLAQKTRYRTMGGSSQEVGSARRLARCLDELAVERWPGALVDLVDCSMPYALASRVRDLAATGRRRFVIANASVADSYELDRATAALNGLHPQTMGLCIEATPPLWGSEALAHKIAERIMAVTADPAATGVALVMHGQTEARHQNNPEFDEQEAAFCSRIRLVLQEQGIDEQMVRPCYHDWESPDTTETVRHLAALGCKRIVVTPACFPFESATTVLDLPVAVAQARVDEHVSTVVLSAWNDESGIAEILMKSIAEALPQEDRI